MAGATVAGTTGRPGADTAGDPYIPHHGNSGYKVASYELDIDYRVESEDLPHVGECLVVVDSAEISLAEAEVTAVDIVPFYEVTRSPP